MTNKLKGTEPFYYGNRLKAQINVYENSENVRSFEVILYKTKKEIYKKKMFFDNRLKSTDYEKQNQLYIKAHDCVHEYLKVCKY